MDYFKSITDNGEIYKTGAVPNGGGTAYKIEDDYDIFDNNCCTKSAEGLEIIESNFIGGEYDPREVLKNMDHNYKDKALRRTEYNKGGETKVTYDPKTQDKSGNSKPISIGGGNYIDPIN